MIAASSSATPLKMPRRIASSVIRAKNRSTKLSHDEEVGNDSFGSQGRGSREQRVAVRLPPLEGNRAPIVAVPAIVLGEGAQTFVGVARLGADGDGRIERAPERKIARNVLALGTDGDHLHRLLEPLDANGSALDVVEPFNLAREVREHNSETGLIIFSYLNPILRFGFERFADAARQAHIDGALIFLGQLHMQLHSLQ